MLRPIGTVFTEHWATYNKQGGEVLQSQQINERQYSRTFRVIDHVLNPAGELVEVIQPLDEVN